MNLDHLALLRPGLHLVRVDYGHPDAVPTGLEMWEHLDLCREQVAPALLEGKLLSFGRGGAVKVAVKGGEQILAWRRLRGVADPLTELLALSQEGTVVVQCRFPRHYRGLREAFEERGASPALLLETVPDGSLPPIYRRFGPGDEELARLHADLEWSSAMSAARGGTALEQVGLLLSTGGAAGLGAISAALGVTGGAAGSYLKWMTDVALLRREGRGYDLPHPAISLRFTPTRWRAHLEERVEARARLRDEEMSID